MAIKSFIPLSFGNCPKAIEAAVKCLSNDFFGAIKIVVA